MGGKNSNPEEHRGSNHRIEKLKSIGISADVIMEMEAIADEAGRKWIPWGEDEIAVLKSFPELTAKDAARVLEKAFPGRRNYSPANIQHQRTRTLNQ